MSPQEWLRVDELLEAALKLEPEERPGFLRSVCGSDRALYDELQSLLAYEERASSFLETPAAAMASGSSQDRESALALLDCGVRVGAYEIVSYLGGGGMGQVYRARDTRLGRDVALKFLAEATAGAHALERFKREARAASALNHPNICTLHDIGEYGGRPFLVMELLDGQSVKERLADGRFAAGEVVEFGIQIAQALEALHAEKIVHRDVKPANIFVTQRGQAKLLDLGLAKVVDAPVEEGPDADAPAANAAADVNLTAFGAAIGTAAFMAPEQLRGEPVDPRADLFSLGVTLYQMATGRLPFGGSNVALAMDAILHSEPAKPRTIDPRIPSELEAIILKALQKQRDARYSNAAEMRADLERLRRPQPFWTRRWLAAAAGLGVAITVLLTAGRVGWLTRDARSPGFESSTLLRLRQMPLTSYPGTEAFPIFSPDGSQVAFVWNGEKQDQFDLYVKPLRGEPPRRLTADPTTECYPAWSPNGRFIAYVNCSSEPDGVIGDRAYVYLVPVGGGTSRKIGEIRTHVDFLTRILAWAPDSKNLVIRDTVPGYARPVLVLLSSETGQKRQLTRLTAPYGDSDPAISPDGGLLAFTRRSAFAVSDVYVLPLSKDWTARGEPRRITFLNDFISELMWTGDGREIQYLVGREGAGGLWRVPAQPGAKPKQVTLVGEIGTQFAMSRAGDKLAYSRRHRDYDIWKADLRAGGESRPVRLISSSFADLSPQFSPNGENIVFSSERSGEMEIWKCKADGSSAVQVTSMHGYSGSPSWSPDENEIAFDARLQSNVEIYVIGADGRNLRQLTKGPASNTVPSWSRDGNWIYFSSNRTGRFEIWKMRKAGGSAVQVTRGGGVLVRESLDGSYLYYSKENRTPSSLWKVSLQSGEEERIDSLRFWSLFELFPDGIYFVPYVSSPKKRESFDVEFYNFSNGRVSTICQVKDKRAGLGFAVSPDRRSFLFAPGEFRDADLMLVETAR